jgi:hypothetical protein
MKAFEIWNNNKRKELLQRAATWWNATVAKLAWKAALQWVLDSYTEVHDGDNFKEFHIYQMIERELGDK